MNERTAGFVPATQSNHDDATIKPGKPRHIIRISMFGIAGFAILTSICMGWIFVKAVAVRDELQSALSTSSQIRDHAAANRPDLMIAAIDNLGAHTSAAREQTTDPLWTLFSAIPVVGVNLSAVTEIARTADDIATQGVAPLGEVFRTLNWDALVPSSNGADLQPLLAAAPRVSTAALAVRQSAERLSALETDELLPQVAGPLEAARERLATVADSLDTAAVVSSVAPQMLGATEPRSYLVMVQNNSEARASGGIPGALAILTFHGGKLTLGTQASTADVGVMTPAIATEPQQEAIYSRRIGKFIQDVNLTPDFPTAASTAQAMWERQTGKGVDGVISIDPIALSYLLEATGPVSVSSPELLALTGSKLPMTLTGDNVVSTLLSDVYAEVEDPALQDAYFAGVAQEVFGALSGGNAEAQSLLQGLSRGVSERRILIWSEKTAEQSEIARYIVSGSISGPSVSPAQFGVYYNDGTGAKMDYYMDRRVQLVKECPQYGYAQTTVRIISTNTAPNDSATSLPAYVTGAGNFGVPPGSVQTNIVVYGPAQAVVETSRIDGQKTDFAPYLHGQRPVAVSAVRLAPGETKTLEFTFGRIVQHTEPSVIVTPTVQDINEVALPIENMPCA